MMTLSCISFILWRMKAHFLAGNLRLFMALVVPALVLTFMPTMLADTATSPKLVVLTFDDSKASHYTTVRPILLKHGFSATFFITEGFTFRENKDDYMSWDQITALHQDGFEIGNHTKDHIGVSADTLGIVINQIKYINDRCLEHGIPLPISFAYPGNAIHKSGPNLLEELGFTWARRGGAPEFPYEDGRGSSFESGKDHTRLLPSAGDARPHWTLDDFKRALNTAENGSIPIIQFHGVPDRDHPWVSTRPEMFEAYMNHLKKENYTVLALKDLALHVDTENQPEDPWAIMEERKMPDLKHMSRPSSKIPSLKPPYLFEFTLSMRMERHTTLDLLPTLERPLIIGSKIGLIKNQLNITRRYLLDLFLSN